MLRLRFAEANRNCGGINTDERMTEHTESRNNKTKLPCHWVEDEGFDVAPTPSPANDPQALADTAFLLKSEALPRPIQSPNS